MESLFIHPSTYHLFRYQFGIAALRDQERVEEHLKTCIPCRDALDGVERNHPAPDSLRRYALGQLYFAQGNVIRLHVTKCPACEQVVELYRTPAAGPAFERVTNAVAANGEASALHIATTEQIVSTYPATKNEPKGNLRPIDVAGFFELGSAMATCLAMGKQSLGSYRQALATLKALLQELSAASIKQRLERVATAGAHLTQLIDGICERHGKNLNSVLDEQEFQEFGEACASVDRAIAKDLGNAAVYYLEAKGGLDARKLIAGADEIFGDSKDQLPCEAISDINQAGTCLALSLATGAAFHIVRATKIVLQMRIETLGGRAPVGYERNLHGYVRTLQNMHGRNEYRLEPLMELRHDPVSDPEVTVTMIEAIVVWATCTDAIRSIIDSADAKKGTERRATQMFGKLQQSA